MTPSPFPDHMNNWVQNPARTGQYDRCPRSDSIFYLCSERGPTLKSCPSLAKMGLDQNFPVITIDP
jgi:hypothetical protein